MLFHPSIPIISLASWVSFVDVLRFSVILYVSVFHSHPVRLLRVFPIVISFPKNGFLGFFLISYHAYFFGGDPFECFPPRTSIGFNDGE